MKKIGEVLKEIEQAVTKRAFIPAPQQGGQSGGGDAPQGG